MHDHVSPAEPLLGVVVGRFSELSDQFSVGHQAPERGSQPFDVATRDQQAVGIVPDNFTGAIRAIEADARESEAFGFDQDHRQTFVSRTHHVYGGLPVMVGDLRGGWSELGRVRDSQFVREPGECLFFLAIADDAERPASACGTDACPSP